MSLLTLNCDALQHLCTFVHGRDALNLALTCRTLHNVAISRVPVYIHCRTPSHLCKLWNLITTATEQALRIRSLTIDASAFEIGNVPFRHRVCADYCEFVGDLLGSVRNLTHLRVDLSVILSQDRRMGCSIASMTNLVHLELNQFPHEATEVLRELQSPVKSLHVDFRDTYIPLPSAEEFFTAVLGLKSLQALSIVSSKPWGHIHLPPPLPPHALLRCLVYCVPLSVPDCIVGLCSRLDTLALCSSNASVSAWLSEAPIPPLRHVVVTLGNLHLLVRLGSLTRARYIHVYQEQPVTPGSEELARLAHCLQVVQPLGLHFCISLRTRFSPSSCLGSETVPRLRCLGIGVLPDLDPSILAKDRCASFVEWLEVIPSCIVHFSLICLRLYIPTLTRNLCPFEKRTLSIPGEDGEIDPTNAAKLEAAALALRDVVRSLPQRLAEANIRLRYIALSIGHPTSMENCRDEIYDCHDTPALEWWWRVGDQDEGGSKVLTPITRAEGLRVWCAILDAEDDAALADIIRRSS
ncbi:hypothetical protein L226DRAFT_279206 [Lentinus tigrinus ALCF2SS1-7]|uniref:uncharacterized protein n=1 Tax=Lentinus tigrinus ALCF2SS1-7 TaxID=1328758 RepID=UPI001165DB1B|nr:hypothetical protein L226DRAFT_279206 [Lentinus tigrinus ALCF2SS1-7]